MYFSLSQPQSTNFEQNLTRSNALYWLYSMIDLKFEHKLQLLTGEKGRKFETSSAKALELFARELVSIYEVKIPARFKCQIT